MSKKRVLSLVKCKKEFEGNLVTCYTLLVDGNFKLRCFCATYMVFRCMELFDGSDDYELDPTLFDIICDVERLCVARLTALPYNEKDF